MCYNDNMEAIVVYLGLAAIIAAYAIKEDRLAKKIAEGYNPLALDADKDGIVQEGTKFERKVKKTPAKKSPAKKTKSKK